MRFSSNDKKGLTLIETLLYVALAGVMLTLISVMLSIVLESRIKNQSILEVEEQGAQIMHIITQEARNAESIIFPGIGESASSLTLDAILEEDDPTVFDASDDAMRIAQGAAQPIQISNSLVEVSNLNFQNLSSSSTAQILRISFTVSRRNPDKRKQYDFEKNFYASASLRQ